MTEEGSVKAKTTGICVNRHKHLGFVTVCQTKIFPTKFIRGGFTYNAIKTTRMSARITGIMNLQN